MVASQLLGWLPLQKIRCIPNQTAAKNNQTDAYQYVDDGHQPVRDQPAQFICQVGFEDIGGQHGGQYGGKENKKLKAFFVPEVQ